MKKFLAVFLGIFVLAAVAGCGISINLGDDEEDELTEEEQYVEEKKEEILQQREQAEEEDEEIDEEQAEEEDDSEEEDDGDGEEEEMDEDDDESESDEEEMDEEVTEADEPEPYTGPNFITIDSPENDQTFYEEPIVFSGVVSPNTEKIVVTASAERDTNPDGPIVGHSYEDVYTLQQFSLGDEEFTYRAAGDWLNLTNGSNNYEFTAYFDDGTTKSAYLDIYYVGETVEMGKPVIYLYPEKTTKIFVNVEPNNGISVSEPEINEGWNVIATPKGDLMNLDDFKVYPYLFWEGYAENYKKPDEGFVVERKKVADFFNEKLEYLGMNKQEISDFKEFWLPRLDEDPYYFISFMDQKNFDEYAPLEIVPEPDSVIRVFFDYEGLEEKIDVVEQKLEKAEREGFSVIEWGGRLYDNNF